MSVRSYNTSKSAFGKVQGVQPRAHARANSGWSQAASTSSQYAAPQASDYSHSSDYSDIIGNAFQGDNYLGGHVAPVKGLRFVSALIDFTILSVATVLLLLVSGAIAVRGPGSGATGMFYILLFILWLGYGIVLEASKHQGTFGKVLTGTVIVNVNGSALSFGQVIGRNLGKLISACSPFYIAYTMAFFTKKSQSLHDFMCGSVVYKKSDLPNLSGSVFD